MNAPLGLILLPTHHRTDTVGKAFQIFFQILQQSCPLEFFPAGQFQRLMLLLHLVIPALAALLLHFIASDGVFKCILPAGDLLQEPLDALHGLCLRGKLRFQRRRFLLALSKTGLFIGNAILKGHHQQVEPGKIQRNLISFRREGIQTLVSVLSLSCQLGQFLTLVSEALFRLGQLLFQLTGQRFLLFGCLTGLSSRLLLLFQLVIQPGKLLGGVAQFIFPHSGLCFQLGHPVLQIFLDAAVLVAFHQTGLHLLGGLPDGVLDLVGLCRQPLFIALGDEPAIFLLLQGGAVPFQRLQPERDLQSPFLL